LWREGKIQSRDEINESINIGLSFFEKKYEVNKEKEIKRKSKSIRKIKRKKKGKKPKNYDFNQSVLLFLSQPPFGQNLFFSPL